MLDATPPIDRDTFPGVVVLRGVDELPAGIRVTSTATDPTTTSDDVVVVMGVGEVIEDNAVGRGREGMKVDGVFSLINLAYSSASCAPTVTLFLINPISIQLQQCQTCEKLRNKKEKKLTRDNRSPL